ncbi:hypothetical protein BDM02DRAFT_2861965 [Thelephora ganbajun]|uniref:Uncharacterized protein n=1 Tax=Thelephora ganbajun TaxID=370292 RepID=A0ACB6ZBC7_THEGA|nr:hypothetical protein BDM02DRAFT_2861965 [Thelephora ganbajun]
MDRLNLRGYLRNNQGIRKLELSLQITRGLKNVHNLDIFHDKYPCRQRRTRPYRRFGNGLSSDYHINSGHRPIIPRCSSGLSNQLWDCSRHAGRVTQLNARYSQMVAVLEAEVNTRD